MILPSSTVLQGTFCEARGSHSGEYEDYELLVCDAVLFYRWIPLFRRTLIFPSSRKKMKAAGSSESCTKLHGAKSRKTVTLKSIFIVRPTFYIFKSTCLDLRCLCSIFDRKFR